jgi:esterase/lipase superfamily enzyme
VLFATDRAVASHTDGSIELLNRNNSTEELTYGQCNVAVETDGSYDRFINYYGNRDSMTYYSVQEIKSLSLKTALDQMTKHLEGESQGDALLFVHGYNTSFDEACRRAAQIGYDLKFLGPILLYSWPSHDFITSYLGDEEMAEWSVPHFTKFLQEILTQKGLRHLHIIAHSMGSRIVAQTLYSQAMTSKEQSNLGQVVFAAPDINRLIFDQETVPGKIKPQRITLYASDHDHALRTSKTFHGFSRAGETYPEIYVKNGIDSIDASAVDTSLLGHSYVGESRSVLADVALLITYNADPAKRFGVIQMGQPPKQWWRLNP